jgi:hypothetical protein
MRAEPNIDTSSKASTTPIRISSILTFASNVWPGIKIFSKNRTNGVRNRVAKA